MLNVKRRIATSQFEENDTVKMVYHQTVVAAFDQSTRELTLDNGGYETVTTKRRMNQFAADHNLSFDVYQENFEWFVIVRNDFDNPIPFVNGEVTIQL